MPKFKIKELHSFISIIGITNLLSLFKTFFLKGEDDLQEGQTNHSCEVIGIKRLFTEVFYIQK